MHRRPTDLEVARAIHYNESLRAPERENEDFDVASLFDEAPKTAPADIDVAVTLDPDGWFRAIDRNTYDVDCDQDGFFSNSPTGHGRTPLDAIVDLLDNMGGV